MANARFRIYKDWRKSERERKIQTGKNPIDFEKLTEYVLNGFDTTIITKQDQTQAWWIRAANHLSKRNQAHEIVYALMLPARKRKSELDSYGANKLIPS
jgi:hypothetical protein